MDQRSLENLRPFPKGVSGNPAGRPKGLSLLARINAELAKPAGTTEGGRPLTQADVIAEGLVRRAASGDLEAIKLVLAYIEGKPAQVVAVGGRVEHALSIAAIRRAIGIG